MADSKRKSLGSLREEQNDGAGHERKPLNSKVSESSITNYFDILPPELTEMILQTACVACWTESDKVFGTLSSVCKSWCTVMSSKLFRTKTIEKLIRSGLPPYYKNPQSIPVRFRSLLKSGDWRLKRVRDSWWSELGLYPIDDEYYVLGDRVVESIPFQVNRLGKRRGTAFDARSTGKADFVRKLSSCYEESINIPLPQPPLGIDWTKGATIMSSGWCSRNRSLYLGYYNTTGAIDSQTRFVCARLPSSSWKEDSARWLGRYRPWPTKSDKVVAWMLPPHSIQISEEFYISDDGRPYKISVSDKTGNVMAIDNKRRGGRLIIYDQNGSPLGVVLMPPEFDNTMLDVKEIVTRGEDLQYILLHTSRTTHWCYDVCRIVIDPTTRSVAGDIDGCPQYMATIVANSGYPYKGIPILADVDDDGFVILALSVDRISNKLVLLRCSDLKQFGRPIILPFQGNCRQIHVNRSKGSLNFLVDTRGETTDTVPLYICNIRPERRNLSH